MTLLGRSWWTCLVLLVAACAEAVQAAPHCPTAAPTVPVCPVAPVCPTGPVGCIRGMRPQDAVWLVSTHHLGCCDLDDPQLRFRRYANGQWFVSTQEAFLADEHPAGITCFYIPASRVEFDTSISRGIRLYRRLAFAADEDKPVRVVIFSWPTPNTKQVIEDFRISDARADLDGYFLAWLLAKMDPAARTSMLAYSMSARIATAALHLTAGGRLLGRTLPVPPEQPVRRVRVVVWSPGMPTSFILPGCCHGEAMKAVDRMLLTYNPSDPVLKRYYIIPREKSVQALGYRGLGGTYRLGENAYRLRQQNVSGVLGKSHQFEEQFSSYLIMALTQMYLLWQPVDAGDPVILESGSTDPASESVPELSQPQSEAAVFTK